MHCRKARILIAKNIRESLTPEQDTLLTRHLDDCHACRAVSAQIGLLTSRLVDTPMQVSSLTAGIARPLVNLTAPRTRLTGAYVTIAFSAACTILCGVILYRQSLHQVPSHGWQPSVLRVADGLSVVSATTERTSGVTPAAFHAHPTLSGVRRSTPRLDCPAPLIPDSTYLDGRDRRLAGFWSAGNRVTKVPFPDLPEVKDDFVRIPFPPLAGLDDRATEAARRVYAQEAQIVDARLQRNVTLHEKAASLESLCAELEKQTGVKLAAARGMKDEKATIFITALPARDVMREVARLFNAFWTRSGEEGAYEYLIKQDLKTQLAEEELRNKDIDAALIAMDEAIITGKTNTPQMQAYLQLTPAERATLRSGKELNFKSDGAIPAGFPAGWGQSLLDSFGSIGTPSGTFTPGSAPGFTADITLSLNHTELGVVSVECQSAVRGPGLGGIAQVSTLGSGRSPSSEKPNNRLANKELERDPHLQQKISITPKACTKPDFMKAHNLDFNVSRHIDDDLQASVEAENPHVNSADVWEAIHEKSGLPIIADYYTRLYPAGELVFENRLLFDALCQAADTMGAHWKKDGSFILCRSASYFWDKLKEVPNRLLDRWQKDRESEKGLPLDDLLEMSQLSDQQLDSKFVGQGVRHCRDIMEWSILASPEYQGIRRKYDQVRPLARFLYTMPKALRTKMQSANGMTADGLPPAIQEALLNVIPSWHKPATYDGMQVKIDYIPAGRYYWRILLDNQEQVGKWLSNPPLVSGKTPEEALVAARRLYPGAGPDSIVRSYGQLALSVVFTDGSSVSIGKRPPSWRITQ